MDSFISCIQKYRYVLGLILFVGVFFGTATWKYLFRAPVDFPKSALLHFNSASTTAEISQYLVEKRIIQAQLPFQFFVWLHGHGRPIIYGDYAFSHTENVRAVARRLLSGDRGVLPIRVTIPEGTDVGEIGYILLKKMPNFSAPYFYSKAISQQGYLFPDTYFFERTTTPDKIISILRNNFDKKFASIYSTWTVSDTVPSQNDIVIMASILEKEAPTNEARRVIAGILWKRLDKGMPLQVDVAKETYKKKGLPEAPITNPGLDALGDALSPTPTKYWFYISDNDGGMHYAVTFDEHRANILKYLK